MNQRFLRTAEICSPYFNEVTNFIKFEKNTCQIEIVMIILKS